MNAYIMQSIMLTLGTTVDLDNKNLACHNRLITLQTSKNISSLSAVREYHPLISDQNLL